MYSRFVGAAPICKRLQTITPMLCSATLLVVLKTVTVSSNTYKHALEITIEVTYFGNIHKDHAYKCIPLLSQVGKSILIKSNITGIPLCKELKSLV